MTLETMKAVTEGLVNQGIDATFEYPGFVAILAGARTINFGDAGDVWSGDVYETGCDEPSGVIDTTIPRDCADAQAIIAATIKAVDAAIGSSGRRRVAGKVPERAA